MDKETDIEIKIMDYYNKNCKDKGLIFMKSEKRVDVESKINFYDFTFQFKQIKMEVSFSDDDTDDDIRWRIKLLLRENDIYL